MPAHDGYEITDSRVAVVGSGDRLFGEAQFLRSYTSDVTVFSEDGSVDLTATQRDELESMSVQVVDEPALGYRLKCQTIEVNFTDRPLTFDTVYAALGSAVRSTMVSRMGVKMTEEGCVTVDPHQRTSIPGLYAAGDVVAGVDQIAHAMGQATVAATAIRNDLCGERALLRASSTSPIPSRPSQIQSRN
jgi:thioredoxin reductase (NADPH)